MNQAMNSVVSEQMVKMEDAYKMLQAVMPEYFFRNFSQKIGSILPLLCNLEKQSGIRRAEQNGEVFFAYIKSDECNSLVTSKTMAGLHLTGAAIHQSEKPVCLDGEECTLVIEHYVLDQGDVPTAKISLAELQTEYQRQFGNSQNDALVDFYDRINFDAVADLDACRLAQRVHSALRAQVSDVVQTEVEAWNKESVRLTVSLSIPVGPGDFVRQLLAIVESANLEPRRCYFREISRGGRENDFSRLPVMVATVYLDGKRGEGISQSRLNTLLTEIRMINWVNMDDLLHEELVRGHRFSLSAANWVRAMSEFVHGQLSFVDRNAYNFNDITRYIATYPELCKQLYDEFCRRFSPGAYSTPAENARNSQVILDEISQINSGYQEKDRFVQAIFRGAVNFLDCILKSNFFVEEKAALAFRLSVDFIRFYRGFGEKYAAAFPADIPYGVFFFFRHRAIGYQVRFTDIARGGWRTVVPGKGMNRLEMFDGYDFARDEIYREVFVLAHTQHLKNKDIYEGGAKMITLLEPLDQTLFKPTMWQVQRAIHAAFLSLVNYDDNKKLRETAIVDYLGQREIIEIGPDENMFDDMIEWMGNYAQKVGYTLGSGVISGKPGAGINHKEYGVTSFGVHQYLLKTLRELGIDPAKDPFSIKIAGGPGGDVAGNEMKLLLAEEDGKPLYPGMRLVAITDGPAFAYDPDGLDRAELRGLLLKSALDSFNPDKLSGEGAFIVICRPTVREERQYYRQLIRQNGTLKEVWLDRDNFMRMFQHNMVHYADVFVPAGGRPSTINESNWQAYFPDEKPAFRAIVEGANSFITPAARNLIQQRGVWIVKDASANKCGVITSSYEILCGLMLDESEFKEHKQELVASVMGILKRRATQEADWLYSNFRASGTPMTDLTEALSRKINAENLSITAFLTTNQHLITDALILAHLPELFRQQFPDRVHRLPEEYRVAVASVELACRLIYASGGSDMGGRLLSVMHPEEKPAM